MSAIKQYLILNEPHFWPQCVIFCSDMLNDGAINNCYDVSKLPM